MKEQPCKYRLPCGWCDKYDRRCEHIEALIAEADWEKEHGCEHDWVLWSTTENNLKLFSYTNIYVCTKCGKTDIRKIEEE